MYLQKLSLVNFKNIAGADLEFSPNLNFFVGRNGSGKTNLLDAIHYLSLCKSYFNPIDSQNINYDEDFFVIDGHYDLKGKEEKIYCGVKRNHKKKFKKNDKEYDRLADHIGSFPLVMISPADADFINGGSETRRRFIDSIISQFDKDYLDTLINYNKVLSQRNAMLKIFAEKGNFDAATMEPYDVQMSILGTKVYDRRKAFIDEFIPVFQEHYEFISGGREIVGIDYQSQLNDSGMEELLRNAIRKDRAVTHTTVGIHKDDLSFTIAGHPIKKFGSQGQQKSFLLALKLAEFDFMQKVKGFPPVLLLDDIFDKLDNERVGQLISLVSKEGFGQVFVTDTQRERVEEMFHPEASWKIYEVSSGSVTLVK